MRIGKRNLGVEVLDESAEGLALAVQGTPDCKIGDTVLVEIAGAWFEARIVNQYAEESPSEDVERVPARIRLGLVRLGEVEASLIDPKDFPLFSWMRVRKLLVPLIPLGKSFKGTAAMLVAIIATGAVLVWALEHSVPFAESLRRSSAEKNDKLKDLAKQFAPSERRTSAESQPGTQEPTEPAAEVDEPQAERPTPPASRFSFDTLPQGVVRLSHPDFLLKPEVIQLLELSRQQRDKLRALFERYKAHYKASSAAVLKAGNDPLVQLGRRCWEILTEKQRESLAQLHSAIQATPGAAPKASTSPETPGPNIDTAPSNG